MFGEASAGSAIPLRESGGRAGGRRADDLGAAEDLALGFEDAPAQPARSVDLGSRGQSGLDCRPASDHEVVSGLPDCEGERLSGFIGNHLAEIVSGRLPEAATTVPVEASRTRVSEAR